MLGLDFVGDGNMPLAPVSRLRKQDIIWLSRHRCRHSHTFLEHYNCYLDENPLKQRIGYFDIEASNLQADYGIMLCYCIKEKDKRKIYHKSITKHDLKTCMDKKVVEQAIKDLAQFDRIVTFYGTRFDFPFLRSRATILNIPFFNYGELNHDDIYYIIRSKFRLSRNRLSNSCRSLLGKTEKTHIKPELWIKALQGNKKSIKWILDHCKRDVRDLEKLHKKVINFKRKSNRSI